MMTGLPEYRNGGLLVDMGLLTLKKKEYERGITTLKSDADLKDTPAAEVVPLFEPADDVIVEWRAVTVGFLDELLVEVNKRLGLSGNEALSLAQMLEAGTWKVSLLYLKMQRCRQLCAPWSVRKPSVLQIMRHPFTLSPSVDADGSQGGREIAAAHRPHTKGPPIAIVSDGTVF